MRTSSILEVDVKGFAALQGQKGPGGLLMELVSNALDTNASQINIEVRAVEGRPQVDFLVEDDDPHGYIRLSDAWTLFGHTEKRDNPLTRGRFNLGCKQMAAYVIATGGTMAIETMTGTVVFQNNTRRKSPVTRDRGTAVHGVLRMTREQLFDFEQLIGRLLIPAEIGFVFNGRELPRRTPAAPQLTRPLQTEVADAEGILRRSVRTTSIDLYTPFDPDRPQLYELGIPVCDMPEDFPFDVNIGQKVPLNPDRDNVPAAYMRKLCVAVLNSAHFRMADDVKRAAWAIEAAADTYASEAAVDSVLTAQYGDKRVAYDPSDREANNRAVAAGYTVIPGGAMSKDLWNNVRQFNLATPAGQVTPSAKPYSADGKPQQYVPPEQWKPGAATTVEYIQKLSALLIGRPVDVLITNDVTWRFSAAFASGGPLVVNVGVLGWSFLTWKDNDKDGLYQVHRLLLHELAHEYESNHLDGKFHNAICRLGAKLAELLMTGKINPESYGYVIQ